MKVEPVRVLHIEDAASDALLLQHAIEETGVDVELRHVTTATAGLELLDGGYRPHLILLDLNLPVMSGHEFLVEIDKRDDVAATPVLVLTTSQSEGDIQRAYRRHANAYYVKPGEFADLVDLAKNIVVHWKTMARTPSGRPDAAKSAAS